MIKEDNRASEEQLSDVRWGSVEVLLRELDKLTLTLANTTGEESVELPKTSRWLEPRNISAPEGAPEFRQVNVLVTETDGECLYFEWLDCLSERATWIGVGVELFNGLGAEPSQPGISGFDAWYAWSKASGHDGYSPLSKEWDAWYFDLLDAKRQPLPTLQFFRFEVLFSDLTGATTPPLAVARSTQRER